MNLKNKKVLITGAGGFIGSHLVERLLEEGCEFYKGKINEMIHDFVQWFYAYSNVVILAFTSSFVIAKFLFVKVKKIMED